MEEESYKTETHSRKKFFSKEKIKLNSVNDLIKIPINQLLSLNVNILSGNLYKRIYEEALKQEKKNIENNIKETPGKNSKKIKGNNKLSNKAIKSFKNIKIDEELQAVPKSYVVSQENSLSSEDDTTGQKKKKKKDLSKSTFISQSDKKLKRNLKSYFNNNSDVKTNLKPNLNTIENNNNNNKNNNNVENNSDKEEKDENILISVHSGRLIKGLPFQNCLIKSDDELINKLRMFIPTVIPKKNKNTNAFNLNDKILTNSININYHKNYIIALKGFNKIENVLNDNDNYLICHDGTIKNEEKYIALIVKKIEGNPQLLFSPEI